MKLLVIFFEDLPEIALNVASIFISKADSLPIDILVSLGLSLGLCGFKCGGLGELRLLQKESEMLSGKIAEHGKEETSVKAHGKEETSVKTGMTAKAGAVAGGAVFVAAAVVATD